MTIKTVAHPPYSPDLAPYDFCLFPNLRGCRYETIEEMKGHWHAHTRGLPWGLPEVGWTVQQVHCCRRRLHRRGLEFYVCTINKSAHTKKSGNLFNDPRKYILHFFPLSVWLCRVEIFVSIYSVLNSTLGLNKFREVPIRFQSSFGSIWNHIQGSEWSNDIFNDKSYLYLYESRRKNK